MQSIAWLENFLINYSGAVIIVAHDRYFLNRVVSKVIEIDHAKATTFLGNYSAYSEKKAQLRDSQLKAWMNQQREIKHQQEVIDKLKSFNREKSIKRAESREKMLEKMEVLDRPDTEVQEMMCCVSKVLRNHLETTRSLRIWILRSNEANVWH